VQFDRCKKMVTIPNRTRRDGLAFDHAEDTMIRKKKLSIPNAAEGDRIAAQWEGENVDVLNVATNVAYALPANTKLSDAYRMIGARPADALMIRKSS
jgi:hypothetical protein